ncbi:hypothetical protein GCM10010156_29910 [Planobispora rosea]|uniref:Major facilitator superfamily (MFS) profile domain-containing protein n=1 Tax=Planobispora rosea TaxID=35762 RepID=A0A8J3RSB4_PLARO|nr:MFS transporter [Planobispora rosea]GGS68974.1 hypothetical protein GCM10010156_29910 [Planobispora rosea]GIH82076.1 hypothetical protein Pro02_04840 [Planobispora rosea]
MKVKHHAMTFEAVQVYGPAAMAVLLSATSNETRGRVISLWSATAAFSLGVSSAVTGMFIDRLGVTTVFVALGSIMAIAGGVWLVARHPHVPER